jgi:hypothetical protein
VAVVQRAAAVAAGQAWVRRRHATWLQTNAAMADGVVIREVGVWLRRHQQAIRERNRMTSGTHLN